MDRPTLDLDDDDLHEPRALFCGLDDDDVEDPTPARVALRYREAMTARADGIGTGGVVTKADVIGLLAARGIEVADVRWGDVIDPGEVGFVGLDDTGQEIVTGTVVMTARVDGDRLVVDADLLLLDDGDIPF